jgi:hypothetical protein
MRRSHPTNGPYGIRSATSTSTYPGPVERGPDGPIRQASPGHALVLSPGANAEMKDDNPAFGFVANPVGTTQALAGHSLSGGGVFSFGRFFLAVPCDPALYFLGEEQSLAVRAWTRGWDSFPVPDVPLHHRDTTSGPRPAHSSAEDEVQRQWRWWQLDQASKARLRALLSEGAALGVYGLGTTRTRRDCRDFCGIDDPARRITRRGQ